MEKIITGEWDGQPIWRQKTAHDKLAEYFNQPMEQLNNLVRQAKEISEKYNPQSSDELYEQRKVEELEEKEQEYLETNQ